MKTSGKIFIGIGAILVIIFFLLYINGTTSECDEGHAYLNESDLCYYSASSADDCAAGEDFDGKYCSYTPEGFISSGIFFWIVVLIPIIAVMWAIIYYFSKGERKQEVFQLKKAKEIDPDDAIDAIKQHWTETHNIHFWEDKIGFHILEGVFKVGDQEDFEKPNFEKFLQFEMEITDGNRIGIFTFIVSLNQKVKKILKGKYRVINCAFDDYKEASTPRPMYQNPDKSERMAEMLTEQGKPEEAQRVLLGQNQGTPESTISPESEEEERTLRSEEVDRRKIQNRNLPKRPPQRRY